MPDIIRLTAEHVNAAADLHRVAGALIPGYDTSLHTSEEYRVFYKDDVMQKDELWGIFDGDALLGFIALLPAMVLVDGVARFIPGVIGNAQATVEESFSDGWLEYPQYTRPPVYRQMTVPQILQTGNHQAVARWRKLQSTERTLAHRPDLIRGKRGSA